MRRMHGSRRKRRNSTKQQQGNDIRAAMINFHPLRGRSAGTLFLENHAQHYTSVLSTQYCVLQYCTVQYRVGPAVWRSYSPAPGEA